MFFIVRFLRIPFGIGLRVLRARDNEGCCAGGDDAKQDAVARSFYLCTFHFGGIEAGGSGGHGSVAGEGAAIV
jgi:hypothetical protein